MKNKAKIGRPNLPDSLKTKSITFTLRRTTIKLLDEYCKSKKVYNRSALFEEIVSGWLKDRIQLVTSIDDVELFEGFPKIKK